VIWVALAAVAVLLLLHLELAVFTPVPRRALRVLMYHRVTGGPGLRYAIPADALRQQISWLRGSGYALISLGQVLDSADRSSPLPDRAVLLTFDDGTADALEMLHPLLLELKVRGALFAIPGWAGSEREEGEGRVRYLDAAGLRMVAATLDIGLHGHEHRDLSKLAPAEVEAELRRAAAWLAREGIPFLPALAYPFGAYPRKDPARRDAFLAAVRRSGVRAAFRIGNRVNPLPLREPLELCRTEIRGDEPFWVFRFKVKIGRRKAV